MKKYTYIAFLFFCILSNGFAQTGPGGVGKNDGSSALKVWFKADSNVFTSTSTPVADNGRVNTWKDASGNNVTATSPSSEKRPTWLEQAGVLNNAPALRFYRNNGTLDSFNSLFTDKYFQVVNATIFVVYHPLTSGGGNNTNNLTNAADSWYWGAGIFDSDISGLKNDFGVTYCAESIAYGEGYTTTSTDNTIKISAPLGSSYISTVTRNNTTGQIALTCSNNLAPITFITTPHTLDTPSRYAIGTTNDATTYDINYFDGYIASIIVFDKKLNDAELIIVQNYLAAKYAISIPNPIDLYTMDQAGSDFDFNVAGIGMGADGISHTTSKGEGSITITNPTSLQANEFLFWGQNSGSISNFTKTNIPALVKDRWEPIWRVSKTGDVGKVDMIFDLPNANPSETKFLRIVQDLNNNGSFSDEAESSFIAEAFYLGGTSYVFKNVLLQDGIRFSIARTNTFEEESKLSLTPNGDGINDVYTITSKKLIKIFDSSGNLVSQMQGPCTWDGTNQNGSFVGTGYYIIEIGEDSFIGITVVY